MDDETRDTDDIVAEIVALRARQLTEPGFKLPSRRVQRLGRIVLWRMGLRNKGTGEMSNAGAHKAVAERLRAHGFSPETATVRHHQLSLLELLFVDPTRFDILTPREHDALRPLVEVGEVGREFATMLRRLPISLPPQEVTEAVARWLTLALKGEASTVFSPVCPDYAVDENGRYTFESLGSGVGLVARRVKAALPSFAAFCAAHQLSVTFVVAMGDSEAENPANCTRVGLTHDEFVKCLRGSQEMFKAATDSSVPLQVPLMTEVGSWEDAMGMARAEAALGRMTGVLPLSPQDRDAICAARRSLYERWYGKGVDVASILKAQALEYMAMGMLARRAYPNCMILGGDAPAMAPFFQGMATRVEPVVYLKKVDY